VLQDAISEVMNSPVALILFMPHMLLQPVALHSSGMPVFSWRGLAVFLLTVVLRAR
jgi:hypothetical protein